MYDLSLKTLRYSLEVHRFAFYSDFIFEQGGDQTAVVSLVFIWLKLELQQIVVSVFAVLVVSFRFLIIKIIFFFIRNAFRQ